MGVFFVGLISFAVRLAPAVAPVRETGIAFNVQLDEGQVQTIGLGQAGCIDAAAANDQQAAEGFNYFGKVILTPLEKQKPYQNSP